MKRITSILITLLLAALLCVPALAASESELGYVTDAAMILSDEEWAELEQKAQDASERYDCGIYIITVDNFSNYVNTDEVYDAATVIYRENSLGLGEGKDGLLLLLSMSERDYALVTYGYGNTAFTSYGMDRISDSFLDNFGDDDWYGGFEDYIDKSESFLESARSGNPVDVSSDPMIWLAGIAICIVIGLIIATIICFVLHSGMKSVEKKVEANTYIHTGSVQYTVREDRFTHRTETRVKIEKNNSSSSSGGGFSGKSGKF